MKENPEDKTHSLYDFATHKGSTHERGLSLEEALAQVDELDNGDKELKAIYRRMYTVNVPRKSAKP
jgi:hypothetical protein